MKRIIICLALGFLSAQAAEVIQSVVQPVAQESVGFLDQIKQVLGAKIDQVEEVRPVVDPAADMQLAETLEGAEDFDFDDGVATNFLDESSKEKEVELSGEEMSEYFADVDANAV